MPSPIDIPFVGRLTARYSDENTWGSTEVNKGGGAQHIEFTLEPADPAEWADVEEEDSFVSGKSEGNGSSAGQPISHAHKAKMPTPVLVGLAKASMTLHCHVSYHTQGGIVVICLDFNKSVRISQTIVNQLAADLNW